MESVGQFAKPGCTRTSHLPCARHWARGRGYRPVLQREEAAAPGRTQTPNALRGPQRCAGLHGAFHCFPPPPKKLFQNRIRAHPERSGFEACPQVPRLASQQLLRDKPAAPKGVVSAGDGRHKARHLNVKSLKQMHRASSCAPGTERGGPGAPKGCRRPVCPARGSAQALTH